MVKDPWEGGVTITTVNVSPSTSLAAARMPGAGTLSVSVAVKLYVVSLATGASLTGVTVIVTVSTFELDVPSSTR